MVKRICKKGLRLLLVGGVILGMQGANVSAFSDVAFLGARSTETFGGRYLSGYVSTTQRTYLKTEVRGYYIAEYNKQKIVKHSNSLTGTGCGAATSCPSGYSLSSGTFIYTVASTKYIESRS